MKGRGRKRGMRRGWGGWGDTGCHGNRKKG